MLLLNILVKQLPFAVRYMVLKQWKKVTFINLGGAYSTSLFTLVIFAKDLANFSDKPEKLYNNKSICVTGIIKEYKGKAEIIVSKQNQITVE